MSMVYQKSPIQGSGVNLPRKSCDWWTAVSGSYEAWKFCLWIPEIHHNLSIKWADAILQLQGDSLGHETASLTSKGRVSPTSGLRETGAFGSDGMGEGMRERQGAAPNCVQE